ncbi:MAG TPA: YqeG family HAD IIIA-type phosphatase [Bacillota bacterium]|nr:YqeG family HAD IIIA-type phosphatase [Bacillota bacterium]
MLKVLKPDMQLDSIYHIDFSNLWRQGYRHIIIDVDNTITRWNNHLPSNKLKAWFSDIKSIGYSICLLSNNRQVRISKLAADLGVIASPKGGKPFSRAFKGALRALTAIPEKTLLIGDQIFTDVLGGNRAGLFTILVDPLDSKEFIGTRFIRLLERVVARRR